MRGSIGAEPDELWFTIATLEITRVHDPACGVRK